MIIRRSRNIDPNVAEASLPLSYTNADVKQFFAMFCRGYHWIKYDVAHHEAYFHEGDVRNYFECDCYIFGNYDQKWRTQLSKWLFTQCVKMDYFIQSAGDPNNYYFGSAGMRVMQSHLKEWDALHQE